MITVANVPSRVSVLKQWRQAGLDIKNTAYSVGGRKLPFGGQIVGITNGAPNVPGAGLLKEKLAEFTTRSGLVGIAPEFLPHTLTDDPVDIWLPTRVLERDFGAVNKYGVLYRVFAGG
jgi:hypothetical protein